MLNYFLLFVLGFYSTVQLTLQISLDNNEILTSFLENTFGSNLTTTTYRFAKLVNKCPSHRYKRETRLVEFEVDGEKTQITLTPINHNVLPLSTPVWTAKTVQRDQTQYTKINEISTRLNGNFYENFNHKAVMYAVKKNNRMNYYGIYEEGNNRKVIQTLPEKLQFSHLTNYSDYFISSSSLSLEAQVNLPKKENVSKCSYFFKKIKKPSDILYPKLLVVVDYNYYEKLYGDMRDILQYISIFWNSVQLKYREIDHPKVKILITGIIIAKDINALNNVLVKNIKDLESVDIDQFFSQGPVNFNLFGQNNNFTNYDNVIIMTNYTTITNGAKTIGMSSLGGICSKTVTFITDNVDFNRTIVAAHELGHSLGICHDKTTQTEKWGTIMYETPSSAKSIYWTKGDVEQLQLFASSVDSWCLDKTSRN